MNNTIRSGLARLLCLVVSLTFWMTVLPAAADASKLVVPKDYPTIQAAVNAAAPGDTVFVLAGTYTEQVTIDRDLKLSGSGAETTIIQAPATLARNSFGLTYLVQVGNGARVNMSGFTVSGPGPGSCGSLTVGVQVLEGANLELSNSSVVHIRDNPPATSMFRCFGGVAIGVGVGPFFGGGSVGHAVVRDVEVSDYGFVGIGVVGAGSSGTFKNNRITGRGTPSSQGVELRFGSTARIQENTIRQNGNGILVIDSIAEIAENAISGNLCDLPFCGPDPIQQLQFTGILLLRAGLGTKVKENEISTTDTAIYLIRTSNCCSITENRVHDNRYFGLVVQDGVNGESQDSRMSENLIVGGYVGIAVVADAVNSKGVFNGNMVLGSSVAPVKEFACCGFTATAIVQDRGSN